MIAEVVCSLTEKGCKLVNIYIPSKYYLPRMQRIAGIMVKNVLKVCLVGEPLRFTLAATAVSNS